MTTQVHVEMQFMVSSSTPGRLEEHLDDVLDELEALEGVADADVTAELRAGQVTVSFDMIAAGGVDSALGQALSTLRTAVHAAGGHTPHWPTFDEAFPEFDVASTDGDWSDVQRALIDASTS